MFWIATHGFVSQLNALFHCTTSTIVSQNDLGFISSRVETVQILVSYGWVALLRLKAYAIMYSIENFLFIRLARNVSLFAIMLYQRILVDTKKRISEHWRYKKGILKKCPYKYIMHKPEKKISGWHSQMIIQIMSALFIDSRYQLTKCREIN